MDRKQRERSVMAAVFSMCGTVIWLIGLAGIPDDLAQWAAWLPVHVLQNPAFYGPLGLMAMYIAYDQLQHREPRKRKSKFGGGVKEEIKFFMEMVWQGWLGLLFALAVMAPVIILALLATWLILLR